MKRWMLIACLIGLVAVTTGCDRREPGEPESYDPQVDGPPGPTPPAPNPMLMKSPAQTVRDDSGTGEGTRPSGTPEEQVRQVIAEIQAAAREGDVSVLARRLGGEGGEAMGNIFRAAAGLPEEMRQFSQYVRDRLGVEPSEYFKDFEEEMAKSTSVALGSDMDLSQAQVRQEGDRVIVAHPDRDEAREFVQENGRWVRLIPMDDETRQVISMFEAMFTVPGKIIQEARAGIESGEITADNLEAKLDEIKAKYTGEMMGEILKAGGSSTVPGGNE